MTEVVPTQADIAAAWSLMEIAHDPCAGFDEFCQALAHHAAAAVAQRDAVIAELRAKLTEEQADAARYHWLRDNSVPPHNFYISVPDEFRGVRYSQQEVDAYIDEARAALANSEVKS